MQRRRVLVLSFFPAFNPPGSGGELRLLQIWSAVARDHEVTLLTSTHMHDVLTEIQHGPAFTEIRVPKEEHAGAIWDELQTIMPGAEVSALGVALGGARFAALHQAYLDHYEAADIIVHTSPFTIDYDIFLGLDGKARVYESYNAEYRLAPSIYPGPRSEQFSDYIAALERRLIAGCDLVTVCSDIDRTAFNDLVPDMAARMIAVPNGVTPYTGTHQQRTDGPARVIFIGSAHRPNRLAADLIISEIAPALPDLIFDIVGGCLDEAAPLPPNVIRHGIVSIDQKAALLEQADIALNPVVDGSGSNLKVAEYLSLGIPLISTAFGVRGFNMKPHAHYISSPLDRFADALKRARTDWKRYRDVGEAGRRHIEQGYSWAAIGTAFSVELSALEVGRPGPFDAGIMLVLNDYAVLNSTGGGSTRIRGLYSRVAAKLQVVFLTYWDGVGIRFSRQHDNVLEISVPKADAHRDEQTRSDAKHHASSADVISLLHAPRNPALVAIYGHLRRFAWRICLEHIYMVGLPQMFGDRFIHSSHNHELKLKQEILGGHPDGASLLRLVSNAESYAVEASSLLVGVSNDDLSALSRGRKTFPPSIAIPNGVLPPAADDLSSGAITTGSQSVVFLGSGHLPNVEAARFIAGNVATSNDDVTFHFVGSVCDSLGEFTRQNIVLWGMVDEKTKSRVLAACQLALNPVVSGGGSNVKFADYLAHGLPVLSTSFGLRGIDGAADHVLIAGLDEFSDAIAGFFSGARKISSTTAERLSYFATTLSLVEGSRRFLSELENLGLPRKRVLFAPYRYSAPPQGGAEAHMLKFVEALSADGRFDVDIVSPDVERIESASRFRSMYPPAPDAGYPVGLARVTAARFDVDDRLAAGPSEITAAIWDCEPAFERAWMEPLLSRLKAPRLLWGWSPPEMHGDKIVVRALRQAAIFVPPSARASLTLRPDPKPDISIEMECGGAVAHLNLSVEQQIDLPPSGGIVILTSSASRLTPSDPRQSAFVLTQFECDAGLVSLRSAKLQPDDVLEGDALPEALARAASLTRDALALRMAEARGPHSTALYDWIATNVAGYDLVITHNAVFKTSTAAVQAARTAGIPSVLVAQVHLDDDFYHFPDVEEAVGSATVSFIAPSEALDFYKRRGLTNVRLLGAGADLSERYTEADRNAFRSIYQDSSPFVLVLGRKSHSKNYRVVLDAVEAISKSRPLRTVMIGIDEDAEPVTQLSATYLGEQPRSVVRGALMSCAALVTMSRSESFGMVILEAWAADAPVIANSGSSAFRDLIVDGETGLLVTADDVVEALLRLMDSPSLSATLKSGGSQALAMHGWNSVSARFVETITSLLVD